MSAAPQSRTVFEGAVPFDGVRLRPGHVLVVEGGRVAGLVPAPGPAEARRIALDGGILAPGFIDVQVNGGGGVMLNDAPTPATMRRIARAHRPLGTLALLPTLITDRPETLRAAIEAAAARPPGVIGLHLEGPHLAPARRGAHLADLMRPMTDDDVALYLAARPRVGVLLLTVAAEMVRPGQVRRLARGGVIVSLGHSDCTAAEAEALFEAGARGATHLFNAMSGLGHRTPGLAAAVLGRPGAWAGMIADGHHVDDRLLRLALAAKRGPGRLFLVSDAMATVGGTAEGFTLNGREVRLAAGQGGALPRLTLADGTLAGAAISLADALGHAVRALGLPREDALRRVTADPAAFLGIAARRGRLRPGAVADLVHLSDNLSVRAVWQAEP